MRIGIVSDTHNHLANVARIVELFNAAGVDRVVHTGDITQAKTLHALAGLDAPVFGVWGNNDRERESLERACLELGFRFSDPPLVLEWSERRITVLHDPLELPDELRLSDAVLHGHTHRRVVERSAGRIVFNPGECAGHMTGHNAIGVLDLESLEPEILLF
ncbi:MAG: metallophosphoesterase [Myxococcota bacterium]